jgi:5-methylcytosine-specific restriction enzyme subunit McrC
MNVFFQRLLSRFLHDNLKSARIADERRIRSVLAYSAEANPKDRSAPAPRPDYALFCGSALRGYLDAKYRDVWQQRLPAEWLYQLALYAQASPNQVSVLLYASMSPEARDERVEVRQPLASASRRTASIIIRPVPLVYLAELVDPHTAIVSPRRRQELAEHLVSLRVSHASWAAA